jgi:hypothetical protein
MGSCFNSGKDLLLQIVSTLDGEMDFSIQFWNGTTNEALQPSCVSVGTVILRKTFEWLGESMFLYFISKFA